MSARMQTRRSVYRRRPGWLVCGTNANGRRVDVFVQTRAEAEQVKANLAAGRYAFDGMPS